MFTIGGRCLVNVKAAPQMDLLQVNTPFDCNAVVSAGTLVAFLSMRDHVIHIGRLIIAGDRNIIDSVDWAPTGQLPLPQEASAIVALNRVGGNHILAVVVQGGIAMASWAALDAIDCVQWTSFAVGNVIHLCVRVDGSVSYVLQQEPHILRVLQNDGSTGILCSITTPIAALCADHLSVLLATDNSVLLVTSCGALGTYLAALRPIVELFGLDRDRPSRCASVVERLNWLPVFVLCIFILNPCMNLAYCVI